ncbi:aspartoacylase [Leptobacterium flavescens]|uniref:Aspartoacylase n=1 Tax=Leptobacterium flavescens TaxID=472055 RepID=A0A6P0UTR4_9FLAO|nr:succinylglutamate desuccinylase/aspartoacylase family protein [Leptobacterium flavescens]NER14233.1 aspartoacylase [Leptobacterium flavescens]
MTEEKTETTERVLARMEAGPHKPAVVFFTGIHGNEPAGVLAFKRLKEKILHQNLNGSLYVLSGNLQALNKGVRYIDKDLNRLWTERRIAQLESDPSREMAEVGEQRALLKEIKAILKNTERPLYFIDFHTTSSRAIPFVTINDAMINRKFSKTFPVPVILGIEEFLEGALLSYINQLGYVSLGFESGKHDDPQAVDNAEAFMYLSLCEAGLLPKKENSLHEHYYQTLQSATKGTAHFFEVKERYPILKGDHFKMEPGFESFQSVKKGTLLAVKNKLPVYAIKNTVLFMPLYQAQGKEGFFLIEKTPRFFLRLSKFLRNRRLDRFLVYLPGISWASEKKEALLVNLKTARFLAKPVFHLLGYRHREQDGTHILMFNRERVARKRMYRSEEWYRA